MHKAYTMSDREDVDPKHLEVALRHAKVIQTQKDVDSHNFESLEKMLDYPLTKGATAESPSQSDMISVSDMLQLWRPVDFTELIEERRIADKCGYVLCHKAPTKSHRASKHKVVRAGQQFMMAPKDKTEAWCSPQCLSRAAYLKYQLKTEPGWLRLTDEKIEFLFPVGEIDVKKSISEIQSIKPLQTQKSISLPIRSAPVPQRPSKSTIPKISLNDDEAVEGQQPILSSSIVERKHANPTNNPPEPNENAAHNAIEGFVI